MALSWKEIQTFLNNRGYASRSQLAKMKLIQRYNFKLLDESYLTKQPHQLTCEEFISIYYKGMLETRHPEILNKNILQRSLSELKHKLSEPLQSCTKLHSEFVDKALEEQLPGIPISTLESLQFRNEKNMKLIRRYSKKYNLGLF